MKNFKLLLLLIATFTISTGLLTSCDKEEVEDRLVGTTWVASATQEITEENLTMELNASISFTSTSVFTYQMEFKSITPTETQSETDQGEGTYTLDYPTLKLFVVTEVFQTTIEDDKFVLEIEGVSTEFTKK